MITASIVLYKTNPQVLVNSVRSFSPCETRHLYLIDNSPAPLQEEKISLLGGFITYIFNGKNLGYGAAHNIALKKANREGSDYHLILNPDITFETKILDSLIQYANKHTDVFYMLPKVIYPDGALQYLCKLLPTPFNLIFRRFLGKNSFTEKIDAQYTLKASGYNTIINPPCLSGCFMFLRMSAIKKYNLYFDDRFFMYCEDFDLIRRLHRVGKTVYFPEVSIIHDHAQESYKNKRMLIEHIKSAIKYFNKYGWFLDKERKLMNKTILKEISDK